MKALLFLIVCAVGGYYGYQYFTGASISPLSAPTPAPTPAPNLLPSGEFFTKERFSVKTEFGVDALPALSLVKRSSEEGEMSAVTDANGRDWKLPTRLLDNNKDSYDAMLRNKPVAPAP